MFSLSFVTILSFELSKFEFLIGHNLVVEKLWLFLIFFVPKNNWLKKIIWKKVIYICFLIFKKMFAEIISYETSILLRKKKSEIFFLFKRIFCEKKGFFVVKKGICWKRYLLKKFLFVWKIVFKKILGEEIFCVEKSFWWNKYVVDFVWGKKDFFV